ncbi:DUF262 domain-containing protein [Streptomyces sp. NPDC015144]|uniref:GmrSD restriction endonuclease domain-containing protein n=1 Tax=Streptomyces sp. NPDC015144 TaxID=3364944 RepID=UPI0036FF9957
MGETVRGRVEGRDYTVRQLFNRQYVLEYYQREYSWERRHVVELVNDLAGAFLRDWRPEHDRQKYVEYRPYFLGPYVCQSSGLKKNLVDGQQRFTTLHLLLIYIERLLNEQGDHDTANMVGGLVRRYAGGQHHYTIDVEERRQCLESLRGGKDFDPTKSTMSVQNLWQRAQDIAEELPEALQDECLPTFADWLADRVSLVEISTDDHDLSWEIFETMNDRGAGLTSLDLLKGFILSRAGREQVELNAAWRGMLSELGDFGRQVPSDFFETLLLARFAASDGSDDDEISRAFHEWIRKSPMRVGLRKTGQDYVDFVLKTAVPRSRQYCRLLGAARNRTAGLESIFYNAANGIDAQYLLILASVRDTDSQEAFEAKAQLLASYLDLVFITRTVNNDPAVQAQDFFEEVKRLLPSVREASAIDDLRDLLGREAANLGSFDAVKRFSLHNNRRQVRYLLARLTGFVEAECGKPDLVDQYLGRGAPGIAGPAVPWEIEHIWANKFSLHIQTGVANERDFDKARNRIGGLLLLEKSDNASFGADLYAEKLTYYYGQNLLAASLNPEAYKRKPRFRQFRERYRLERTFKSYQSNFDVKALDERAELYQRLCELVWDVERLGFAKVREVAAQRPRSAGRRKTHYGIQVADLIHAGLISVGAPLSAELKRTGQKFNAVILEGGRIRLETGEEFGSLSGAGAAALGASSCPGWDFWHSDVSGNGLLSLASIRKVAIAQGLLDRGPSSARSKGAATVESSAPVVVIESEGTIEAAFRSNFNELVQRYKLPTPAPDPVPPMRACFKLRRVVSAGLAADLENFGDVFDGIFQGVIEDHFINDEQFLRCFMDDRDFRRAFTEGARQYTYKVLRVRQRS